MVKAQSFILLTGLALTTACASNTPSTASTVRQASPDYITSVEVNATPATNAWDLVSRLRPRWFQAQQRMGSISGGARTQEIAVYLDGTRMGSLEALKSINSSGIKSLQYYDATRAATVLRDPGSQPIAGAIVITTTKIQ